MAEKHLPPLTPEVKALLYMIPDKPVLFADWCALGEFEYEIKKSGIWIEGECIVKANPTHMVESEIGELAWTYLRRNRQLVEFLVELREKRKAELTRAFAES